MGNLRPFKRRLTTKVITWAEYQDGWRGWWRTLRLTRTFERKHTMFDGWRTPVTYHQKWWLAWQTLQDIAEEERKQLTPYNVRYK